MKDKLIPSIIAISSVLFPAITYAATVVNGGSVKFSGEVVNSACAVDVGSSDMQVKLGQVRAEKLNAIGATSGPVPFYIALKDCDINVSTSASVAFEGVGLGASGDVLSLSSGASGAAKNVGIQLFSGNDTTPLKIDGNTYSKQTILNNGDNKLSFVAKYYAAGAATAGSADAAATFRVQYD